MEDLLSITHRTLSRQHVEEALQRRAESPNRTARFVVLGRYGVGSVPTHARASVREAERLVGALRQQAQAPTQAQPTQALVLSDDDEDDDDDMVAAARWDPNAYVDELQQELASLHDQVQSMEANLADMPRLRQEVGRCAALRDAYGFLQDAQLRASLSLEQLAGKMAALQQQLAACQQEAQARLAAEARALQAAEQGRARQCAVCMAEVDPRRFHIINCSQQHRVCCGCAHEAGFADGFVERRHRALWGQGQPSCPKQALLHSCPGCWTNAELREAALDMHGAYIMNSTHSVSAQ